MEIRITERKINAVPAADEELGRGELTEIQVNGINALADEVFNELYYDYMDNDQSNLFEGYLGVVTYLSDVEPAAALEIIACMMREHELDDQFDKVLAFVPKDEAHIKAFARHFAIAGIMKKLDEEAMEEDLEEEMEEDYTDLHCKGCMGACFVKILRNSHSCSIQLFSINLNHLFLRNILYIIKKGTYLTGNFP